MNSEKISIDDRLMLVAKIDRLVYLGQKEYYEKGIQQIFTREALFRRLYISTDFVMPILMGKGAIKTKSYYDLWQILNQQ